MKQKKKIVVNVKALNEWLSSKKWTYRELAERTGMSNTQAFNLTKKSTGGAVTLGYLATVGAPVFFLVTTERSGGKDKVVDVQRLEISPR